MFFSFLLVLSAWFTVQMSVMDTAVLRDRKNNNAIGNLQHGRRHVVVYLDSRQLLGQAQKVLAALPVQSGKLAATVKQVGATLEAWILLIEFGGEDELVLSVLAALYQQRRFFDIIVPAERVSYVQASIGIEVLHVNHFYHHLLPGTLLRVRLASTAEQKENIDHGRATAAGAPPSTRAQFLALCHKFALFHDCFAAIDHMHPPQSSSMVPYDIEFWHRRQDTQLAATAADTGDVESKPAVLYKKLVLPLQAVTFIIGKRGKSIEQIRQQTSAVIKIHDIDPTNNDGALEQTQFFGSSHSLQLVSIHGSQADVNHTQCLIEEKLRLWKKQQLLIYQ